MSFLFGKKKETPKESSSTLKSHSSLLLSSAKTSSASNSAHHSPKPSLTTISSSSLKPSLSNASSSANSSPNPSPSIEEQLRRQLEDMKIDSNTAAQQPQQTKVPDETVRVRQHFQQVKLSSKTFQIGETLGTGTFGRVRVVTYSGLTKEKEKDKPSVFALKMLKKSEIIRLKQVEHIRSEKAILSTINHPFIVNLYATFQDPYYLFMLMEYVIGGELFSQLRKVGRFSNDVSRFYAAEIVLALEYLHAQDIVYRDLKPENLLIDKDGHIKITDFGFAKKVEDRTWTLCGTPEYLAPEIIQGKGHGKPVDWWALGILIFEMLAGYPPFYDENPYGIYQKILLGDIVFPKHFDPYAKDIVKRLLQPDKTKRFGCLKDGVADIKNHRWFKGIEWQKVYEKKMKPPFIPAFGSTDDTSNFDKYDEDTDQLILISEKEQELFSEF